MLTWAGSCCSDEQLVKAEGNRPVVESNNDVGDVSCSYGSHEGLVKFSEEKPAL